MDEKRPNPDALLKQFASAPPPHEQGALKIFFGYAAGVGKTFAMLEAAHAAKEAGVDVVAGYIEPHTRPQTLALLEGLEILPVREIAYKDMVLKEFDIDAAIKRKPELILVDELAHSNGEGCRHLKRYQDIEELLKLGIDVYTTVNVQHIESLNDIVAAITGVIVRERIPDRIFDSADQVELVDIEYDDLVARLHQGKIYKAQQAQQALGNFFSKENLNSLREIALRRAADRVNKVVEKTKPISPKGDYFTGEHILICLSGAPSNDKVIRTAARMASAFHGAFTALFVETPKNQGLPQDEQQGLQQNLKLAQQLGAKIVTVYGEDIPYQIAEYAKVSGISKIVIGRSNQKKSLFAMKANFIDRLTVLAPNLDIYVIPDNQKPYGAKKRKVKPPTFSVKDSAKVLGVLTLATLIGFLFWHLGFSEANIITVYILGVLVIAFLTEGKFYGVVASFLGVLFFNFFFTVPQFTFEAFGTGYPVTFMIMFLASLLTSTLTKGMKSQAYYASIKAYRTEVLLETSQRLQRAKTQEEIISATAGQMVKLLERDVVFYVAAGETLASPVVFTLKPGDTTAKAYLSGEEEAVAHWVYKNNKQAGATTNTLPGAKCLYMAVRSNDTVFAVVGVTMAPGETLGAFDKNVFMAMLAECALAVEKQQAMAMKNSLFVEAKQEQLRANLLRAISHDLRTPLTSISGNAGILMNHGEALSADKKQNLYADIYDDAMWLISLVENLLSVTRLENGAMAITTQPELLQEVIEEALCHVSRKVSEHQIRVEQADEFLMAQIDPRLMMQVIINMVDNAIKYTPPGSEIVLAAKALGDKVEMTIADNGEGIAPEAKDRLFEMFFTTESQIGDARRGLGLGLALCKAIVEAHGGTLTVADNVPRGTVFRLTLMRGGDYE